MGMRPTARMPKLTRRSRILILIALGVIALLLAGPRLIDAYVDWLWFGELGYRSVFSTVLVTRFVVFLIAGLLVGGIVFAGLAVAYRTRPVFVPSNDNDPVARYRALVLSRLRLVSAGVPVAIGLLAGIIAQSHWVRIQLFLHGGDFGIKDPQFGKDLGFYAFELPFYRLLLSYLFVAVFLAFVANLLAHYIFGGIRLSGRTGALSRSARIQLVTLVGLLVLLKAVAYWLDRYELLSHTRGGKPFTGAGYTDINAVLPAKLILMAIALICAGAVFSAVVLRDLRIPAIGLVLLLLSSLIVGAGWPLIVEQISVKPNAAQKESEYISRSIAATRQAYGLTADVVTYRNYTGDAQATAQQVADDRATTSNIRLLDPTIVSPAFTQFQQGKNFYYFPTSSPSTATWTATGRCGTTSWRPANSTPTASSTTSATGSTGTRSTPTATGSSRHRPTRCAESPTTPTKTAATLNSWSTSSAPTATSSPTVPRRSTSRASTTGPSSPTRPRTTRSSGATAPTANTTTRPATKPRTTPTPGSAASPRRLAVAQRVRRQVRRAELLVLQRDRLEQQDPVQP